MKRHRVRLRPKQRRKRRFVAGLAAAGLLTAALCAAAVKAKPWRRLGPLRIPLPRAASVDRISFGGAPDALREKLFEAAGWEPGQRWGLTRPMRTAARLRRRFPCLRSVRARRSWSGRSVRFEAALRRPVAAVPRAGGGNDFLGEEGTLFPAPEGTYPIRGLPEVRWDGEPDEDALGSLSRFLIRVRQPQALPSRLVRMDLETEDGWALRLENGTRLEWGSLRWTEAKLSRLGEVLADAWPRFGEALTADLRHFGDGRILIRTESGRSNGKS